MAGDSTCNGSSVAEKLKIQYAERTVNTSKFTEVDAVKLRSIVTNGVQVCVIHDRLNALVHSYSVTVYKDSNSDLYIVYEGGFAGNDQRGFGPVTEGNL